MVFDDFFRPGVEPADLPALFPLLRARDALGAFTALFRGSDVEVLISSVTVPTCTVVTRRRAASSDYFPLYEEHLEALTTEEVVRQTFIRHLVDLYGQLLCYSDCTNSVANS